VRGQLLPIIDLRQFPRQRRDADHAQHPAWVVVNHREIPAGLLVDEVLGFRRFGGQTNSPATLPPTGRAPCERYLAGAFFAAPRSNGRS